MKYVCVRQREQADCGAAALATVCLQHRRPVGLPRLRELAGVDKVGASMAGLKRAAEALGFVATGAKAHWDALARVPVPAIAHVRNRDRFGHFVVVHRVERDRVVVADPGAGLKTIGRAAFEAMWSGRVLLLSPQAEFSRQRAEEDDRPQSRLGRLSAILSSHGGVLARIGAIALILTIIGLAPAVFMRVLVDDVLVHAETSVLDVLGIGMLLVLGFRVAFSLLREYFLGHLGRRLDLQMQSGYVRRVLALPVRFFETRRVGDILMRMVDVAKVNALVGGVALGVLVDAVLLLVFAGVMFWFDARLAAVSCAFAPVLVGVLLLHQRPLVRCSREAMEHGARLQSRMVEDLGGVATLRVNGATEQRLQHIDERLVDVAQARFRVRLLGMSMSGGEALVTGGASLAVLWYGGHLVIEGALSIGQLMFFNTLLAQMLVPLRTLVQANVTVQDGLVALERLGEVVDLDPEVKPGARGMMPPELHYGIALEQASFGYGSRAGARVLNGLDLVIPAGRTTAIVGASGCGKSTVLRLLLGLYRPTSGRVSVDGIDLRDVDLERWRANVAWVPQDATVFDGTIAENVALGDPTPDLGRAIEACRMVGLSAFVDALPERYDTMIGERGASLSGGQRQLLAIARAVYRDARVIVLDEATSMLDAGTERALRDRLAPWLVGRTVVIVAHRLATVRDAAWIYVMGEGCLLESGTHAQLLTYGGVYAGFWRDQQGTPMLVAAPSEDTVRYTGRREDQGTIPTTVACIPR